MARRSVSFLLYFVFSSPKRRVYNNYRENNFIYPDFVIAYPKKYKSYNFSRQECKKQGFSRIGGRAYYFTRLFVRLPKQQKQPLIIKHLQTYFEKVTKSGKRRVYNNYRENNFIYVLFPKRKRQLYKMSAKTGDFRIQMRITGVENAKTYIPQFTLVDFEQSLKRK